ncbi:hypothetical protein Trydic_g21736, partial [Trypoxylus dichotomus]
RISNATKRACNNNATASGSIGSAFGQCTAALRAGEEVLRIHVPNSGYLDIQFSCSEDSVYKGGRAGNRVPYLRPPTTTVPEKETISEFFFTLDIT